MKTRKPLQRRTGLKRKPFPKNGRGFRQPDPTRAQVKRHKAELAERRRLKAELLKECPRDQAGNILCPRCKKRPDFRGLQLVHKKSLGSGGKTTRANCCIRCAPCHFGHGEPWSHKTEGRPESGLDNHDTTAVQSNETEGGSK